MPAAEDTASVSARNQPALYIVHSSIDEARDAEFNEWYSTKHCVDVLEGTPGVTRARRFKRILGDDSHSYIAVYEFEDESSLHQFLESDLREKLLAEHHALWDPFPDLNRGGYVEIWSSDDRDVR